MSDYTELPKDLSECLRKAGEPLSDNQYILISGYLGGYQQQNQYVTQVGNFILSDDGETCIVSSSLRDSEDGGTNFMILNDKTGAKYRVDVKITEI